MIENYLQTIVENRRHQHYLLDQVRIICNLICTYSIMQLLPEDYIELDMDKKKLQVANYLYFVIYFVYLINVL
jgi:hypothetical protein